MKKQSYIIPIITVFLFSGGCSFWGGQNKAGIYEDVYSTTYRYDHKEYNQSNNWKHHYRKPRFYHTPAKVPNSFHFTDRSSPRTHKSRDLEWIHQQSPDTYTIEIASGHKPADVARVLHKSPRNARKAQFHYIENNKQIHKGVYGTFTNKEQALQALENLPQSVRHQANIKQWQTIQVNTPKPEAKVESNDNIPKAF